MEFKSYYVVWKPSGSCRAIANFLFKSYYVVWKLLYLIKNEI